MHHSKNETRIIKRIYSKRKNNNPLLVIYPDGKETWCQSVDIHGSSNMKCKNGILTTTTQEHVVVHIALEQADKKKWIESIKKEQVKYKPGMRSCAGVEWPYPDVSDLLD